MTKVNTQKSMPVIKEQTGQTAAGNAERAETRRELEQAMRELAQFEMKNAEFLTDEQLAEMSRLRVTMQAQATALDSFGLGGNTGTDGSSEDDSFIPRELEPGWNGNVVNNAFADDEAYVNGDAAKYGTYQGTIELEISNSMDDVVGFSVGDEVSEVYVESHGADLLLTTVDAESGDRKTWVFKNGSVNGVPFIVDASRNTQGVLIDASRTIRRTDGSMHNEVGGRSGLYIRGGSGNDTILGSQSDDGIVAGYGDDVVRGFGGDDTIYGDNEGADTEGGNDILIGGAGDDKTIGGRGIDTTAASDSGEFSRETERRTEDNGLRREKDKSKTL